MTDTEYRVIEWSLTIVTFYLSHSRPHVMDFYEYLLQKMKKKCTELVNMLALH